MSDKYTAKELERMMLYDAIQWQLGYVDSVRNTDLYADAKDMLSQYRALYKRRYGSPKTKLDAMLEGANLVPVLDIGKGGRK